MLDVGVKGAGSEFGVPVIRDFPDVEIPFFLAEEHVVVRHVPGWPIGQVLAADSQSCLHHVQFVP